MVPHVVCHKRDEMGLLVILPGPVVLATSNTILRGVGRVLLDLPMMAVFSVASLKKVPTRTGPRCAPSACYPC